VCKTTRYTFSHLWSKAYARPRDFVAATLSCSQIWLCSFCLKWLVIGRLKEKKGNVLLFYVGGHVLAHGQGSHILLPCSFMVNLV
jgi:hypothetical protein